VRAGIFKARPGWRNCQGLMDADEIVVHEIDRRSAGAARAGHFTHLLDAAYVRGHNAATCLPVMRRVALELLFS
jgi:hypothetical protein